MQISIFVKFTGIMTVCLLLIFSGIALLLTDLQERFFLEEQDTSTDMLIKQVADVSATPIKAFTFYILDEQSKQLQALPEILSVRIYNTSGKHLNPSGIDPADLTVPEHYWLRKEHPCLYTPPVGDARDVGRVEIIFSLESIYQKISRIQIALIFIIVLAVVIVDAVVILMLRTIITRPLSLLTRSAQQLSSGDFDIRNVHAAHDEIGFLGNTFVTMSQKLKESFEHVRRSHETLQEERNLLRTLIDSLPDQIYVKDTGGRFLLVNETSARNFGAATPDAIVGKTDFDLFPAELAEQYQASERMLFTSDTAIINVEETSLDQNQETVWLAVTQVPFHDSQGKIAGFVGINRDITERKQVEEELRMHRDHLEERVNQRTTELRKTNAELHETLDHLQQTQHQLIESEKMAALGQLVAGVAHEINSPLGAIRASIHNIADALKHSIHQLPRLLVQFSPQQQTEFFAFIAHALQHKQHLSSREERRYRRTLQRELETRMIENADTLADTLVDMGVYDNIDAFVPLFQLDMQAMMMQTAYNLVVQQHDCHNIITAVDRAAKIVFALKNYTHYDTSGEEKSVNVAEGIDCVLTLYHNQLKHDIELVKAYGDVPEISGYPDELPQVWTNLIHNAIQAMKGKGTLEITIQQASEQSRGSGVVVQITDSGHGIPDDVRAHIFDPFFTTRPPGEGSGLGLDIVRKIVEKHQGKIEVESQPGKTTFSVWLPGMK